MSDYCFIYIIVLYFTVIAYIIQLLDTRVVKLFLKH